MEDGEQVDKEVLVDATLKRSITTKGSKKHSSYKISVEKRERKDNYEEISKELMNSSYSRNIKKFIFKRMLYLIHSKKNHLKDVEGKFSFIDLET